MKIEESVLQNWKEKIINTDTLIDMYGEDILKHNFKGNSLIHIAVLLNDKFLMKDLLNRDNISLHAEDSSGITPIRLAIIKKRSNFIKSIISHPSFDIQKEKKSNPDDFLFEREYTNRNYLNNTVTTKKKEIYKMFDEDQKSYKPSLLSLVLLNKMDKFYPLFSSLLKDEKFSYDLSLCFDNPGFENLSYKNPIPVSIFEIALYSGNNDIAMDIFESDPKFITNLIKEQIQKNNSLLLYTSKGDYGYDNKTVLKHYPLHHLVDMFIESPFLKKEENFRLKNSFTDLSLIIKGNFFSIDSGFTENLTSLIEQFLILKNSDNNEKAKPLKKRRI